MSHPLLSAIQADVAAFMQELSVLDSLIQSAGGIQDGMELRNSIEMKQMVLFQLEQRILVIESDIDRSFIPDDVKPEIDKCRRRFGNARNALQQLLHTLSTKTGVAPPQPPLPTAARPLSMKPLPTPPARPQSQYPSSQPLPQSQPQYQPQYQPDFQQQQQQQLQTQSNALGDIEIDGKKLEFRDSVYWDTVEVEQRNEEMQRVSEDLVVLHEVFKDAAVEVQVQGEQLGVAEESTMEAQANTKSAVKSLGKSSKNAKKVVLPAGGALGGAVIGGLTGAVAFGPIGAVVGAGIGAGCGAVAGAGTGKVLRMNTDKTMHKARLNEAWQPDKSVTNCTGCQRKFTATFRKHHCRNCGYIYCQKCTKRRANIPGVESEGRQLVCDRCYNEITYQVADAALGAGPIGAPVGYQMDSSVEQPIPNYSPAAPVQYVSVSPMASAAYGSPPPRPSASTRPPLS